jgi:hypothetical protein
MLFKKITQTQHSKKVYKTGEIARSPQKWGGVVRTEIL